MRKRILQIFSIMFILIILFAVYQAADHKKKASADANSDTKAAEEETKATEGEAKVAAEETKADAEEAIATKGEAKAAAEETKADAEEAIAAAGETKAAAEETIAAAGETETVTGKAKTAAGETETGEKTVDTRGYDIDRIDINFTEHKNEDNDFLQKKSQLLEEDITLTYCTKDYDGLRFIICVDNKDNLNIAYLQKGKYNSLCQIPSWPKDYAYVSEIKTKAITEFEDILGHSGVKITIQEGAAAVCVFYIAVDDQPKLLVSASLSGGFSEYDINQDGQKELIAPLDNYMYLSKDSEQIDKGEYILKDNIKQICFEEKTGTYDVIYKDNEMKEFKYAPSQDALIMAE